MDGTGLRWRQVGATLTAEIDAGAIAPGTRLPADTALAERFGVNRHTVRRALQDLQAQGLLRSEKGRGTFVVDDVVPYRLGARTRFSQNLLQSHRVPGRRLLSVAQETAQGAVARQLAVPDGAPLVATVTVSDADGLPIGHAHSWFPAARLPDIAAEVAARATAARFSFTEVLRACGVPDYRRQLTLITARPASADELRHLRMPRGEGVLETESVDVDPAGQPVLYARTAFRAARVQFVLES